MTERNAIIRKKACTAAKYIFLTVAAVVMILPFFWMVISSFKDNAEVFDSTIFFPSQWRWQNYPEALSLAPFGIFFRNSIIVTIVCVASQLITCSMAGFAFARLDFRFRDAIFRIFLACLMIPNEATVISNYITVSKLGLVNTFPALMLISLTSVLGIFIMRQFFVGIPNELKESARIDGCTELQVLFRIILPLSKAIVMTIGLYYGVSFWNDFFNAMLYLNDNQPLPILLRNILLASGMNEYVEVSAFGNAPVSAIKAASVFMSAIPMIVAYPFIQKYFTKGTLLGSVKG